MAHVLLECLAVLQTWRHVALVVMAYSTWQCFGLCLGKIFLTGFMRARMELFSTFFRSEVVGEIFTSMEFVEQE